MKYIGAHVSASGGVEFAPVNAHEIGSYVIPQPKEDKNYQEAKGKPRSIARIILI